MAYAQDINYLRKLLEQERFANVQGGSSYVTGMEEPDFANVQAGHSSRNALAEIMQPQGLPPPPDFMPPANLENPQRFQTPNYDPTNQSQREAMIPLNSMRNNETGELISLNFGGQQQPANGGQKLGDRVEYMGKVGRYTPDSRGIVFPDGSQHRISRDRDMQDFADWFKVQKGNSDLAKDQMSIARDQEAIQGARAARNVREDPTSQAVLDKRFGKAPDGMRWKPDGTPEPMPGGKPEQQGKKALELLDEADKYIDGSTGSGIGAVADTVQGWFGGSNKGAENIGRLQTIAGQLVSMMPRMEGPQSNMDVQLYKQMAGDIANPSVPVEKRKAAMQQIRDLNAKYAGPQDGNQGLIDEAKKAIARGAPREAVMQRLRERGITSGI